MHLKCLLFQASGVTDGAYALYAMVQSILQYMFFDTL